MDLQKAIDYFILTQNLRGNSPRTIETYINILGFFKAYLVSNGITNISDLTIVDINMYHMYLRSKDKPIKQVTIRSYLRHIRAFLSFCYKEELITTDLAAKVVLPKIERPAIEILTSDEINAIFDCFSGYSELGRRNTAILCVMLDCGLRAEEVANLKTSDINFNKGYLNVYGKGQKGRIVPIGLKARKAVMTYMYKRSDCNSEYIFLTIDNHHMTGKNITRIFRRLKKQTGIVRVHAHLCRHTFATNYLLYGLGDIYQLSRILGHSDVKTTEIYLHIANYYKIIECRKDKNTSYIDSFLD